MKSGLRYIVLCIVLAALYGCQKPDIELPVRECKPMPVERACATTFVVNDQVYVFAGRDNSGKAYNDLWRYSPETDSWTSLGMAPMQPRVNATACVKDGNVYLGLGFLGRYGQDTCYLRDWWRFTPANGAWQRLADYPNTYTDRATSFVGDGELYVGYGFCWNYRRDMFRYTIEENKWDSIDVGVSFHGYPTRSFGGTGGTCNGRHFMGTGYYRHSLNWWAELVDGTHWEKRKAVPGRERTLAASAVTDSYIYLCGGIHYGGMNTNGEVLKDIRRYDPQTDSWKWVAVMTQGLLNHVCFAVKGKVYWGLGEDDEWHVSNKLYCIEE